MTKRKKIIPVEYDDQASPSEPTAPPLVTRGKQDWNERAKRDPLHWTVNSVPEGEWDLVDYMATGEGTVVGSVDNYMMNLALALPSPNIVAEIGCGAGRITAALAKRFDKIIASDISGEMIKSAKKNLKELGIKNVEFREGNGFNLDIIDDASVDMVVSIIVFQHIPDPAVQMEYLREVARILKPGGYFIVSLYDDEQEYKTLQREWLARRALKQVADQEPKSKIDYMQGWDALGELELDRFETSMSTPMGFDNMRKVLDETGMQLLFHRGRGTNVLWTVGRKP